MSETELLALLRELDDPERLEWPLTYDRAAASLAFGGLVRRLETDFETQCEFEQDAQAGRGPPTKHAAPRLHLHGGHHHDVLVLSGHSPQP